MIDRVTQVLLSLWIGFGGAIFWQHFYTKFHHDLLAISFDLTFQVYGAWLLPTWKGSYIENRMGVYEWIYVCIYAISRYSNSYIYLSYTFRCDEKKKDKVIMIK